MTRFRVGAADGGERLDVVLAAALGESRSRAARRIERGEVTVDGEVATKSDTPSAGQEVAVSEPSPPPVPPAPPPPPIRYRDEHLLVVAKPAGMVTHHGPGWPGGTLVDALREAGIPLADSGQDGRPGIVHRLDRGTSGLLAVASSPQAYEGLVAALKARTVRRRYLALVEGELDAARGRVEAPIGRDPHDRQRFAVVHGGKPAVTHWTVLDVGRAGNAAVSLVRCRLETGRTHQIRVHLSEAGHPVAGDRAYGASRPVAAALGLERPFLHAVRLAFEHPVTGADVDLTEPPPEDLLRAAGIAGVAIPG